MDSPPLTKHLLPNNCSFFDKCPPLLPEEVAQSVVDAIVKNKVHVELPKMISMTTSVLR